MTDDQQLPTRQAQAIDGRSSPLKVTGKLKAAIDLMVWQGSRRAEAAEKAGIKDHSLRTALRKPHVLAYYHGEIGVLRESTRAKNFHRLEAIADQDENRAAAVSAIKVMEGVSDPIAPASARDLPRAGYVIDLSDGRTGLSLRITSPQPQARRPGDDAIDVTPTDDEA